MDQPRIVCDNSVWYRIGDGRISRSSIEGLRLVATCVNGHELTSSPNLFKDYQHVHDAVETMIDCSEEIIEYQPIEYVKLMSGHKADLLNWDELRIAMDNICFTAVLRDETRIKVQSDIEAHIRHLTALNQPLLMMIEAYRQTITNRGYLKNALKTPVAVSESLEITKQLVETLTGGTSVQWENFELFARTFNQWLYELSVQDSLKMNNNDWADLLNLVYVAPGDQYWAEDNRKTKEFIKRAGCSHYLHEHNAPVN